MAGLAGNLVGVCHLFLEIGHDVLKVDLDVDPYALADIRIALGTLSGCSSATETEEILEDASEPTGEEIAEVSVCSTAEALGTVDTCKSVAVVVLALCLVRQNLIGLGSFLEPLLRGLVAWISVRMVLYGKLPVCLFNIFL